MSEPRHGLKLQREFLSPKLACMHDRGSPFLLPSAPLA
jgi:hypothetical protein